MGEQLRVLYVEDDPDFAELAIEYLEGHNARLAVEHVTSGTAAVDHLDAVDCDCIVSDFELEGLDGIDLLKRVRDAHDQLPFIIFTGRGGEEVASEAIRSQVTDYLQKRSDPEQFDILANRIEHAVEKHRAQTNFQALFERLHLGVAIQEPDHGTIIAANESFAQLVGIDREAIAGAHPGDFSVDAPAFSRERATECVQRTVSLGPQTFEWQIIGRDDEPIWVEVHLTPTRINHRDRVLAFVEDITDRKQRDDAIKNLHEVAAELASSSSREEVYELTIDAAGRLFEFDRAALAIERDGRLEVVAMSEAMPLDERPTMATDEGIAGLTYREGASFLIENVAEDDRAVPQMEAASAMSVPVGDRGVFQVIEDRPGTFGGDDLELAELLVRHTQSALELLDRESTLERKNDRLEEFVSFVSHDLRGPLSVALGRLELIEDEFTSEHTTGLADALAQMEELIEALLALAREGGSDPTTVWTDLHQIAQRCWSNIDSAGASLEVDGPITVMADPHQLQQLIDNLLRNAVDHGGPTATVSIGGLDDGFFVADDGPGIPIDERDRIFTLGYSTSDDGVGYGLKIVQEVAAQHGWTVEVTEGEGGGARFEITGGTRQSP